MHVNAPATISSFDADGVLRHGQPGRLLGSEPLKLGGSFDLVTSSPNYTGEITIDGDVAVRNSTALGKGSVVIAPGGVLDLAIPQSGGLLNEIILDGGKLATDGEIALEPVPGRLMASVIVKSDSMIATNFRDPIEISGTLELKDGARLDKLKEGLLTVSGNLLVGSGTQFAAGPGFLRRNDGGTFTDHLSEVRITGTIKSAAPNASIDFIRSGFDNLVSTASVHIQSGQTLEILENGVPIEFNLGNGKSLTGNGTILNPVRFAGGILDPGQSPGQLTFGDTLTIGPGTAYDWEINNATGAPGQPSGWDLIHVDGRMVFETTMASPFVLRVTGLNGANQYGSIPNFDPRNSYQWLIASADLVTGFDPAEIRIDLTALLQTYPALRQSSFSLRHSEGDLLLVYWNQVPEPNTALLIMVGAVACLLILRRVTH